MHCLCVIFSQSAIDYLDLSGCNQLTNTSVADVLATSLPCLKSLIFESCNNLKDLTVQVPQSFSKLQYQGYTILTSIYYICILSVIQWRQEGETREAVASPMLKKMALVILPNSMRKIGVVEFRCEQITKTKYFM